jgi:hypothetical protein
MKIIWEAVEKQGIVPLLADVSGAQDPSQGFEHQSAWSTTPEKVFFNSLLALIVSVLPGIHASHFKTWQASGSCRWTGTS